MRMGISIGDELAGLYTVIGVLAALAARVRDGQGEAVDVALTESSFSLLEAVLPEYAATGKVTVRNRQPLTWRRAQQRLPDARRRMAGNRCKRSSDLPALRDTHRPARTRRRSALRHQSGAHRQQRRTRRDHRKLDPLVRSRGSERCARGRRRAGRTGDVDRRYRRRSAIYRPRRHRAVRTTPETWSKTYLPVPRLAEHPARLDHAAGKIGRDQRRALLEFGLEP